jgi:LDH2 family malate/lactate/ureidoglycolate dehydrogenase
MLRPQCAYGRIRQAKKKVKASDNSYVDKEGNITTDPNIAYAVCHLVDLKVLVSAY